jgi:uncharacterized repeat protein (TIGR01451 family)
MIAAKGVIRMLVKAMSPLIRATCAALLASASLGAAVSAHAQTSADVSVSKSAPGTATVGVNFSYTITVFNNGPGTATIVTVTDVLPPGINFVAAGSTAGCASNGGTVTCPVGSLGSGASAVVTIVANPTISGSFTNVAGAMANEADGSMGNNSASATTAISGGSPPPVPTGLVATATSATQVGITWSASAGATSYQVERSSGGSGYVLVGSPTGTSFTDPVSSGTTYLYQVRAVGPGGTSAPSNKDLATTILFADDPLTVGVTLIKAQHLTQLRQAVNAVRAAAALAASSWTDPTLTVGVTSVKKVHIDELRSSLSAARTTLGFSDPGFTDPVLTAGVTVVKKIHTDELRQRVK